MATKANRDGRSLDHFFRFTSPLFPELKYEQLKQYFNSIEVCEKLYTCPKRYFGKVYYKTPEIIAEVQQFIEAHNIHQLVMGRLNDGEEPVYQGQDTNHVVKTEIIKVYDANGKSVALLEDSDTNTRYISIKEAEKCGYTLFPSIEAAQKQIITELNGFLTSQAKMFLNIKGINYNVPNDIEINVKFVNVKAVNNVAPKTPNNKSFDDVKIERTIKTPSPNVQKENKFAPPIRESKKVPIISRPLIEKAQNMVENKDFNGLPNLCFKAESKLSVSSDQGSVKSHKSFTDSNLKVKPAMSPRQILQAMSRPPVKSNKVHTYPAGSVFVDKMAGLTGEMVQVIKTLTPTSFVAFIMTAESAKVEELEIQHELLTPTAGELILVELEDKNLRRAYILEIKGDTYKVALIDYGEVVEVKRIYELAPELKSIDEYICICDAPAAYVEAAVKDGGVVVNSKENNKFIDVEKNVEIICRRWMPEEFQVAESTNTNTKNKIVSAEIEKKPEQKVFTTLPTDGIMFKVYDLVALTKFDGGMLYLRSKEMRDLVQQMIKKLENQKLEKLDKPPTVGQYVFYKHNNEMRRCLIKKIVNGKVDVEFIDYSTCGTVPVSELLNFTEDAVFGPTLDKRRLRHFEDKEYSEKANAKMLELLKKRFTVSYLQDDFVDLKQDASDKKHLSELLLDLDAPKVPCINDLPAMNIQLNQEIRIIVSHVENDEIFFLPPIDDEALELVSTGLACLESADSVDSVEIGQICVALYEGDLCRAEVKHIDGAEVTVHFFDFGNSEVVNLEVIKAFPDNMLSIAPCAVNGILTEDSCESGDDICGNIYLGIVKKLGTKHYVKLVAPYAVPS